MSRVPRWTSWRVCTGPGSSSTTPRRRAPAAAARPSPSEQKRIPRDSSTPYPFRAAATCDAAAALFLSPEMLSALRFLLSPWRLRFMRRYANPAMGELRARLDQFASPQGRLFVTTLLKANAEFL